jgi:hypothetical protein
MKFKALISAVALAAAGVAHADIGTYSSQGAVESFVTVFNANASITIDLGLDQSAFKANLASPLSYDLSANSQWSTFVSKAGTAPLYWSVQSVDLDNNDGFYTARIGQEALAGTTTGGMRVNNNLDSNYADLSNFIGNVNSDGTVANNNTTVALAGTPQYWNMDGANSATGFTKNSNLIGSAAVSLFEFQDNINDPYNPSAKYTWSQSVDTVTLNNNYVLTFQGQAVTPAVPEPSTYGLALVALAAIGFVARRRSV